MNENKSFTERLNDVRVDAIETIKLKLLASKTMRTDIDVEMQNWIAPFPPTYDCVRLANLEDACEIILTDGTHYPEIDIEVHLKDEGDDEESWQDITLFGTDDIVAIADAVDNA